jgi:hypothetical protein
MRAARVAYLISMLLLWCTFAPAAFSADSPSMKSREQERKFPKFSLYGVKTLAECAPILESTRAALASLQSSYPADWTIDIACTDVEWQRILMMADQHKTNTAFTMLEKKHTIINGAIFRGWRSTYRRTLSHELGHILCNCASESVAEKLAAKME